MTINEKDQFLFPNFSSLNLQFHKQPTCSKLTRREGRISKFSCSVFSAPSSVVFTVHGLVIKEWSIDRLLVKLGEIFRLQNFFPSLMKNKTRFRWNDLVRRKFSGCNFWKIEEIEWRNGEEEQEDFGCCNFCAIEEGEWRMKMNCSAADFFSWCGTKTWNEGTR